MHLNIFAKCLRFTIENIFAKSMNWNSLSWCKKKRRFSKDFFFMTCCWTIEMSRLVCKRLISTLNLLISIATSISTRWVVFSRWNFARRRATFCEEDDVSSTIKLSLIMIEEEKEKEELTRDRRALWENFLTLLKRLFATTLFLKTKIRFVDAIEAIWLSMKTSVKCMKDVCKLTLWSNRKTTTNWDVTAKLPPKL